MTESCTSKGLRRSPGLEACDLGRCWFPEFAASIFPDRIEQIAWNEVKTEIESRIITFPVASASLSGKERDALQSVVANVKDLLASSAAAGRVVVRVIGHSDSTGAG